MSYKIEKRFEHKGFNCVVVMIDFGTSWRVGYVELKEEYEEWFTNSIAEQYIACHGGITFYGYRHEYGLCNLAIGFDCHHLGDNLEDCNVEFCISECKKIAEQLENLNRAEICLQELRDEFNEMLEDGLKVTRNDVLKALGFDVPSFSDDVIIYPIPSSRCEYCDPDDLVTFIAQGRLEIKVGDVSVGTIDVDTFINSDGDFELSGENEEGRRLFKSVKKIKFCPMCGRKL